MSCSSLSRLCLPFWILQAEFAMQFASAANSATNNNNLQLSVSMEIMAKKTFTIALLLVTVTVLLRLEPAQSSNNFDDDVPREKAKKPKLKPPTQLPEVTNRVYLDIEISNNDSVPTKGRIILGLFGKVAPKTVENFRSLCLCDKGMGIVSGKPLCYKGSKFHRIIPNFIIQGGDITDNNGVGGESIYGGYFEDETFEVLHNKLYLLNMANKGPDTNGSQFFINTVKTSWLDNKNVVFGVVLSGFEVVDQIDAVGSNGGEPQVDVVIIKSSGELPLVVIDEKEQ